MRGEDVGQDVDDFAAFYEAARDDCLRTVTAATLDGTGAEDLVAEAFARAWASWRRLRVHPSPRGWVVRTALNANVSAWRRYRRERARVSEGWGVPDTQSADDPYPEWDLMTVLRQLPERQRQVLALRVFLDLDVSQTAATLGIAEGTARAHLSRAIARLRRELLPTINSEA